jgi:hypothetical protein
MPATPPSLEVVRERAVSALTAALNDYTMSGPDDYDAAQAAYYDAEAAYVDATEALHAAHAAAQDVA